ncbi:MAG: hypothetical protein B7Y47_03035 [Sphingomonas sp. 28-63-12]|nr:MAG: hypothetical protein B7Y47_03035 [Sphingomonas sp. 28-63-12]
MCSRNDPLVVASRPSVIVFFGTASLIAVLAGCWTAAASGVATAIWARQVMAWLVGLGLAVAITRFGPWVQHRLADSGAGPAALLAVIMLLALGFAEPGLQAVHRWIVIGPVRINVAAIALPVTLVLLHRARSAPVAMVAIMLLLIAQPDASQASGFGVAAVIMLATGKRSRFALAQAVLLAMLGALAWCRPDPLASVAEVEGILSLAGQRAPAVAIVAAVALALAALAPLRLAVGSDGGAGPVLAGYMVATALAPAIGHFPVPLVGMSMSPVIGFWLGIGALAAQQRDQ